MPKIFHVNWFRTNEQGKFLWPGYGENIRVIDWMCKRLKGDDSVAETTPIGYIPKKGMALLKTSEKSVLLCRHCDVILLAAY